MMVDEPMKKTEKLVYCFITQFNQKRVFKERGSDQMMLKDQSEN
jgi:hypothetical protein